jgi:hypothetical protein
MKTLPAVLVALTLCSLPMVAHADLIPPGGEGVSVCQDKKAGDPCMNFVFEKPGIREEPGTCVEEKLDHLHFKFKAHLRCHSASIPKPQTSASASASAAPAPVPSASASSAPQVSSAAPAAPSATSSAAAQPEAAKSGGCSWTDTSSERGAGLGAFLLGLGILVGARRHKR